MTPCQDTLRMSFTILKKKNFQIWTKGRKRSEEKKERDQKKKRKEVRGKIKGRRLVAFLFVNQILSVKVFIPPKVLRSISKREKKKGNRSRNRKGKGKDKRKISKKIF